MEKKPYWNCLTLVQALETQWALLIFSEEMIYRDACHQLIQDLFRHLETLPPEDEIAHDPWSITLLRQWLEQPPHNPENLPVASERHADCLQMFVMLGALKTHLLSQLQIDLIIPSTFDTNSNIFFADSYRWNAILPKGWDAKMVESAEKLLSRPDTLSPLTHPVSPLGCSKQNLSEAARERERPLTISVMGDIRRSQDLMTYADPPDRFANNMTFFLEETRCLIGKHFGLFEKFTGDGFLAYFDAEFCRDQGRDYIDCFMEFLQEERAFALPFFAQWEHQTRKLPEERTGLSIGADIGYVRFFMKSSLFLGVGDSIVWAARMASAGKANEVIINNLLYHRLYTRPDLIFKERIAQTKSGEKCRAYELTSL